MDTNANRAPALERAGYRVEGPGDEAELAGRYWWTLYREGWSGIECGADFASRDEAVADAWASLQAEREAGRRRTR